MIAESIRKIVLECDDKNGVICSYLVT